LLWVDAEAFGEAAIAARCTNVPSAYEVAIKQYAGELRPKDHKEAWTQNRREELRRLYLTLLLDLATLYEGREEYERGIEVLRRALSEDPSREETHADLMRLYAHCGRRREPLAVGGEAIRQVGSLSLPETRNGGLSAKDLMDCEAVRLFVERASVTAPDFELTQENAGAVVRVCRMLDGIPLAIELAAAQIGDLTADQVAGRLEGSLDLLQSNGRSVEPKQQTLRAHPRLEPQALGRGRESVVRATLGLCGRMDSGSGRTGMFWPGIEQNEVLDRLGDLVDRSLVVAAPAAAIRCGAVAILVCPRLPE
jgi:hypothetical protein